MTWPNVRLTITPSEYSLLKPGLDFLACQLANAKHGHYLARLAWDRAHPPPPSVYERMEYDEDGAQAIIRVRAKLCESEIIPEDPRELRRARGCGIGSAAFEAPPQDLYRTQPP